MTLCHPTRLQIGRHDMTWDGVTPKRVLAVGELLWDLLPGGARLGGAPFNVVAHVSRLGLAAAILSAVGVDELGRRARTAVKRAGVGDRWIHEVGDLPTGTAGVVLGDDGSPTFQIARPAAYDGWSLSEPDLGAIVGHGYDALVFGTLAQQTPAVRAATSRLVSALPRAERLYDVNLRKGCWDLETVQAMLALATIVKLNEEEARVLGDLLGLGSDGGHAFMAALAQRSGVRAVCLTRGPAGSILLLDGEFVEAIPPAVSVVDTVGAGDAFAAAILAGVLAGQAAIEVIRRATALGALVAARAGATPDWTAEELSAFEEASPEPRSVAQFGQIDPSDA